MTQRTLSRLSPLLLVSRAGWQLFAIYSPPPLRPSPFPVHQILLDVTPKVVDNPSNSLEDKQLYMVLSRMIPSMEHNEFCAWAIGMMVALRKLVVENP